MQLNLIDLSRRLYCKLNALHLKWALRSVERRIAASKAESLRLLSQREEIRAELTTLKVPA